MEEIKKNTLAMCCIVKNEERLIRGMLMSCVVHIDCAVICDTGSEDDTVSIACKLLEEFAVPYKILKIKWEDNFAEARNRYLEELGSYTTHVLVLDADEMLVVINRDFKKNLPDIGLVELHNSINGDINFYPNLFKTHPAIHYEGEIHETPLFPKHFEKPVRMKSLYIKDRSNGANREFKYQRDLEICLRKDPFPSSPGRRAYYLALSAFHTKRIELALHWFKKRAEMEEGSAEEKWHATMMVGSCYLVKDNPLEGIEWLQRALDMRSWRLEPLALMEKYYILTKDHVNLALIQIELTKISYPENDTLAIQEELYYREPSKSI